jgi:hypothetical protein
MEILEHIKATVELLNTKEAKDDYAYFKLKTSKIEKLKELGLPFTLSYIGSLSGNKNQYFSLCLELENPQNEKEKKKKLRKHAEFAYPEASENMPVFVKILDMYLRQDWLYSAQNYSRLLKLIKSYCQFGFTQELAYCAAKNWHPSHLGELLLVKNKKDFAHKVGLIISEYEKGSV